EDKIFKSILAGATGYLLKDDKPSKVLLSIEEVMLGGAPMSTSIASKVLSFIKTCSEKGNEKFNLTDRELQILQRIGKGENYQQIADVLFISPKTVRNHIEKIYKKLQVHNKVDAVTMAIKNKLIV
ncbi:MAG: response regulator transcription factor, partial [Chlorobi bacterium]|nr:response regulator transcription factor [Chlorobiota bacterium]